MTTKQISNFLTNKNVMLDIETLGIKPGCKILSIGACTFASSGGVFTPHKLSDTFYHTINPNTQYNLVEQHKAKEFWYSQSVELYEEAFSGIFHITEILNRFSLWFAAQGDKESVNVWGNGASFDISILEAAYEAYSIPIPWHYRNVMCFRTLKNMYGYLVPEPTFIGAPHIAIDDAIHQARWAELILDRIDKAEYKNKLAIEDKAKSEINASIKESVILNLEG